MFLAVPAFHYHMRPVRQRDADHSIDMVHINTSNVIQRVRVIEQGEISQVSFFESCSSVCLGILVFFHSNFSRSYSKLLVERKIIDIVE